MQWEHKYEQGEWGIVAAAIDLAGRDGWELVTVVAEEKSLGYRYKAFFKRQTDRMVR